MISGVQSWTSRDTGPRMRRLKLLIFRLTPRGLAWPRLEITRSSRISSMVSGVGSTGGKSAGIDDPAAHDIHGMDERQSIGVLSRLPGGLVDQAAHGIVGEHEPVDFLVDKIRGLGTQGGTFSKDVGLDLVMGVLDFPPLVVERRQLGGRGEAMVKEV